MISGLSFVHKLPQPFIGPGIFSPPEISVARLVQGSPDNGDTFALQLAQLLGHCVYIPHDLKAFTGYLTLAFKLFYIRERELGYVLFGDSL